MAQPQFRSPINLGIPAVPDGVPDELVQAFSGIYSALKKLQQAIGDYTGANYMDLDYLLQTITAGQFAPTIQNQNMQIAPVLSNLAITKGQFVNLFDTGTELRARKADASAMATRAHGWALNTTSAAGQLIAIALLSGYNPNIGGMTRGINYWLSAATPGGIVNTPPVAVGTIRQEVGLALGTTELLVHISAQPIQN